MLSKDVCSVRLSVTRRYSVETAKHIIKLFSPSGSHTILVFPHQTVWQHSDGNPPNGGVKCWGYEKCDFRTMYRFISETIQDTAIRMRIGNRVQAFEWYHSQ